MPTNDRSNQQIDEQLAALEAERKELESALAAGDLSQADYTKAVTKNHFLTAQIQEQHKGGIERDKERKTEKKVERKRDLFTE